jgi:hypothetical protein
MKESNLALDNNEKMPTLQEEQDLDMDEYNLEK